MANEGPPSAWAGALMPGTTPLLPQRNVASKSASGATILYPDSDGKPMAENTKQLRWIVILFGNLSALYRTALDVFVGADLLWYPVEGHPEVQVAPDVLVAFGRPKGDRGSYRQWEENNVPLTVVFEILSPGNTPLEMMDKFDFYDEHGVEEYYVYDPDANRLVSYRRGRETLRRVRGPEGLVSPRLGIRFDLSGPEMVVFYPDGQPFLSFEELADERLRERRRADEATLAADQARQRFARLAELSRKARRQEASADELQELDRLEAEQPSS